MAFALLLFINSCKKELYNTEKTDPTRKKEMLAFKNGPKIEIINLAQFKNKANLNALGTLKQEFVSTTPSKSNLMSIQTAETYLGFNIITDSIKVIKDKGHTMYVFPVALASKRAASFQNLTIDEGPEGTVAFVNTYTPTKKWIAEWKKGHPGKFEGDISVNYLNLNNGSASNGSGTASKNTTQKTIAVAQICTSTTYYFELVYSCASGIHYPGDECWLSGDDRAGYIYVYFDVTTCVDDPNQGGGGGGGGTTPTPPVDYDPCDSTNPNPPTNQSFKKSLGNKVMIVPPTDCDVVVDCAGVRGGSAYRNPDCNTCMGGTTGIIECPPIKDIRNKTTDTCISKTIEAALGTNGDIEGMLAGIIQRFDASKTVTLNIFDGTTANGGPGQYQGQGFVNNVFQANITLSNAAMTGSSKEFAISVLIHEFVHAYIHASGSTILQSDHNTMSSKYIAPMASYLVQYFGINIKDAYALAWYGVGDSNAFNSNTPSNTEYTINNNLKITKSEILNIGLAYSRNQIYAEDEIKRGIAICK